MVFESIPTLDEDEFYKILMENPQDVSIVEVGDFIESDDVKNGYYFYITFFVTLYKSGEKDFLQFQSQ